MEVWRNIKDYILAYSSEKYYLVSFPKTGRSWLMYMLSDIINLTNIDVSIQKTHDLSEIIIEDGTRQNPNLLFKYLKRFRYRRSNVIFLVRDPRDVIVSHYHQVTKRSKNPFIFSSISDFVQDDVIGFNRIIHFYNLWFLNRSVPISFHLVKYEDLLHNGVGELLDLCNFLGINVDRSSLEGIYQKSSASIMRNKEIKNQLQGFQDFGKDRDQLKVRKAKIGGYLDELSDEDIDYCNKRMQLLNPFFNYSR